MSESIRIHVGPVPIPEFAAAVTSTGATLAPVKDADAVIFTGTDADPADLLRFIGPRTRWVQLPQVGVERWAAAGVVRSGPVFTCARGAFSDATAEHTIALMLAAAKRLDEAIPARRWLTLPSRELHGAPVTIIGGGAISEQLTRMLAPFDTTVTVVSNQAKLPGVNVVPRDQMLDAVRGAAYVVVLVATTPHTVHLIGADVFNAMGRQGWLVNMSRGPIVDTTALVSALQDGLIAGAALDVTDPEPLPDGHPLWSMPRVIITPHSATPRSAYLRGMAGMIVDNIGRFSQNKDLLGVVDPARGY